MAVGSPGVAERRASEEDLGFMGGEPGLLLLLLHRETPGRTPQRALRDTAGSHAPAGTRSPYICVGGKVHGAPATRESVSCRPPAEDFAFLAALMARGVGGMHRAPWAPTEASPSAGGSCRGSMRKLL